MDARLVDVENATAGVEMGAKADADARRVAATMSFMIDVVCFIVCRCIRIPTVNVCVLCMYLFIELQVAVKLKVEK